MCASPLKANALLRANLDIVKRLIHSEASLKYILNSRYVSCVIKVLECELKKIIKTPSTFCAITDALQEHSPYDAKQFFTDNQSLLFDLILHSHRDLYSDFTLDNDYSSFKLAIGRYTSSMSYLFEQRSSGIVPKTEQPQLIFSYIEHVKVKIESSRFSALYLFFLVTLTDEYLADRFQQFSSLKSSLLQQAGSYLLNESTGVISCSELVALLSCYSQEKQFEMIDNLINRKKPLSLVGDKETLFSYALQPHYDKVAQAFEEKALASGHRPKEEPLDLSDNSSVDKGAQALAKALTSGNCPSGLKLDISSNEIGDKGAQAFAKALASGHRPKGEPSDLSDNSSGNKGAEALARALESGQCPSGLKLELNTDDIYPKSYKAFQAALESGKRQSWEKLDVREDLSSIDSLPDLFFMMMRLMIRSADDFVCVTERLCLSKGVLKKIIKESGSYIIDTIRTFDQLNVVLDSMDEKQQEDTLSNNMSLIIDHVSDLYTYDEASELCKEHSSLMHRLYVGVRSSLNLWLTDDPDDMGCGDFNDELFIEVYSSLGRDDQQDWFETHMGALVETLKSLPDATTDDCSYDSDDDFGVSFIGLFVDVFPHLNPKDQDTLLSDESICTKVIADSENRSEVLTYVQASLNAKGGQGHTGGDLSLFASSTQYVNLESFKRRLEETQSKELAEGKLSL